MTDREDRHIGNMHPDDIISTRDDYSFLFRRRRVRSLASGWALQGIDYVQTDPVPTEKYTTEELKGMGLIGVTLLIPKSAE